MDLEETLEWRLGCPWSPEGPRVSSGGLGLPVMIGRSLAARLSSLPYELRDKKRAPPNAARSPITSFLNRGLSADVEERR